MKLPNWIVQGVLAILLTGFGAWMTVVWADVQDLTREQKTEGEQRAALSERLGRFEERLRALDASATDTNSRVREIERLLSRQRPYLDGPGR